MEQFYDDILDWCINQQYPSISQTFEKFKLIIFHHYANFLRAHRKYDKALKTISAGLNLYNEFEMNVDTVYKINLELQKQATKYEMSVHTPKEKVNFVKLRRALEFKLSPETIKDQGCQEEKAVQTVKGNVLTTCKDTAFINLCSEDESFESLDLSDKRSKSRKVRKPAKIINEREKNLNNKTSSSTNKEPSCSESEEQKVNIGKTKSLSNSSPLGNLISNLNKVNNGNDIPVDIHLQNSEDIENFPFNIITEVNTQKIRVNRDKNRTKKKKNSTNLNEKCLFPREVTAKLEVLHINANKNAKKEVVKQTCEPTPIVSAEKSVGRPKNITAEKTNNRIQVQEVKSKRNTRQQTKMLN